MYTVAMAAVDPVWTAVTAIQQQGQLEHPVGAYIGAAAATGAHTTTTAMNTI